MRIRIQRDLRTQFLAVCQEQDIPAAQVIRDFMRRYVKQHAARRQTGASRSKTRNGGRGANG